MTYTRHTLKFAPLKPGNLLLNHDGGLGILALRNGQPVVFTQDFEVIDLTGDVRYVWGSPRNETDGVPAGDHDALAEDLMARLAEGLLDTEAE